MNFEWYVSEFHNRYGDKPLSLWITGGGFAFLDILRVPGSSRFLHEVVIPYSETAIIQRVYGYGNAAANLALQKNKLKSCDPSSVGDYAEAMTRTAPPNGLCIAVTAALTTNRYRRGSNRAYFGVVRKQRMWERELWELTMLLPTEKVFKGGSAYLSLRRREDELIAIAIMALATGDFDTFKLPLNDSIARFNSLDEETVEAFQMVILGDVE